MTLDISIHKCGLDIDFFSVFSVGSRTHYDATLSTIGPLNRNGCPSCCHYCCSTTVRNAEKWIERHESCNIVFIHRSIFPNDAPGELMVSWHVGRSAASNLSMFIANVLAVHLPWPATKWAKILNILSSKINSSDADMVVRHRFGYLGKVQWASRSNL